MLKNILAPINPTAEKSCDHLQRKKEQFLGKADPSLLDENIFLPELIKRAKIIAFSEKIEVVGDTHINKILLYLNENVPFDVDRFVFVSTLNTKLENSLRVGGIIFPLFKDKKEGPIRHMTLNVSLRETKGGQLADLEMDEAECVNATLFRSLDVRKNAFLLGIAFELMMKSPDKNFNESMMLEIRSMPPNEFENFLINLQKDRLTLHNRRAVSEIIKS